MRQHILRANNDIRNRIFAVDYLKSKPAPASILHQSAPTFAPSRAKPKYADA